MKTVIYSKHAILRMYQRDISESLVESALKYPDYTISRADGTKKTIKSLANATITIVFVEKENYIKVVTVY